MVLPIIGYGAIVLKTKAKEIPADYPELHKLISDMYETMYDASGVGLAAPQIGKSIRLFVIDTSPFDTDDFEQNSGFEVKSVKKTFINPIMIDESGENASFEEGCLSIPNIREHINRKSDITIKYQDENFTHHQGTFSGILARVIQHEYDHLEGTLFTDKISPFKKKLIKGKLNNIMIGKVSVDYKMKFFKK
ncbi:MAG: peptide deformylase [Flavobacteriaceae bacterium]|nr:peptide deformylase [Flavobacteriaceae bacterium]